MKCQECQGKLDDLAAAICDACWQKRWGTKKPPPAEQQEGVGQAQLPATTQAAEEAYTIAPSASIGTILFADGFEDAFIGIGWQFNNPFAVYDIEKCKEVLRSRGLGDDEAMEYLDFNVLGAYVGTQTPVFLDPTSLDVAQERIKDWVAGGYDEGGS